MKNDSYKLYNCYEVLGVPSTASPEEIRTAYRKASFQHHPDRGGTHEAQIKVNAAFEILSDPISRQAHDTYWLATRSTAYSKIPYSQPYSPPRTTSKPTGTPFQSNEYERKSTIKEPLRGFRNRIISEIEKKKVSIWNDLGNRSNNVEIIIKKKVDEVRTEIWLIIISGFILAGFTMLSQFPLLWFAELYLGWLFIKRIIGVQISNYSFSIIEINLDDHIHQKAQIIAKDSCENDITKLDHHLSTLASLSELLLRPSTFDDSEEQVARRLSASFFLMGYNPLQFDRENRAILFTDGTENVLVRYRHRSGIATNISFVEKLTSLMYLYHSYRGFLFCSPGLSGNAANYASQNRIKSYSIETMNNWIEQVLLSDYSGPNGDVLPLLDNLISFIGTISPAISFGKRRYRYQNNWFR